MKKNYERYFGKNIARKLYVIGLALAVIGLIVSYFIWAGYGVPLMVVGVLLFFVSSSTQVSDKAVDEKIEAVVEEYAKQKIEGRMIGKEKLDSRDFSVFTGFIRETPEVRFKSGSDGKMRTSRYYVTAVSASKENCKVFTTIYDLISDEVPRDKMISTKGADKVEFSKEPTQFPAGNYKCELKVTKNGESETFEFYLPDDALADQLTEKIAKL